MICFTYSDVALVKGEKHQKQHVDCKKISEPAVKKNKGVVPWHILYCHHCDVFLHFP